jgi:hypothetical protein
VAIVILGLNTSVESEGHDRDTITLPGVQEELIKSIIATKTPTVPQPQRNATQRNATQRNATQRNATQRKQVLTMQRVMDGRWWS